MAKKNIRIFRTTKGRGSTTPFTQLPNAIIDDLQLSNGAFRILVQVLRKMDNYKFHIKHYSEKMGFSRTTMREYINELIHYGYCRQVSITRSRVEFYWYESPEFNPDFQPEIEPYNSTKKIEPRSGEVKTENILKIEDVQKLTNENSTKLRDDDHCSENKLITEVAKTDHHMYDNWSENDPQLITNNTKLNNTTTKHYTNTQNNSCEETLSNENGIIQKVEEVENADTKYEVDQDDEADLRELNYQVHLAGEKERRKIAEEESRLSVEMYFESDNKKHYVKENISPANGADSLTGKSTKGNEKPISLSNLIKTDNQNFIGRLVQVFDQRTSATSISQRAQFCYHDYSKEVFFMAYNEKVQLLTDIQPGELFHVEYTTGEHVFFLVDLFPLDEELRYINKKPTVKRPAQTVKNRNPYNDMMR